MIELDKVLAIPENLSGLTMNAPNWQLSAYQRKQKLANASHKLVTLRVSIKYDMIQNINKRYIISRDGQG